MGKKVPKQTLYQRPICFMTEMGELDPHSPIVYLRTSRLQLLLLLKVLWMLLCAVLCTLMVAVVGLYARVQGM